MVELGKHSRRLLELAYPPEKYGAEDLDWMERMLKHMSARTIWRVFDSCNNYSMPKPVPVPSTEIQYWYGSTDKSVPGRTILDSFIMAAYFNLFAIVIVLIAPRFMLWYKFS